MPLGGDALHQIFTNTSSFLSSIPLSSYMTSFVLACILWLVGALCFSTLASSPDSGNSKQYSKVEAFRNIFHRHVVQPADRHIREPLQTLLKSSSTTASEAAATQRNSKSRSRSLQPSSTSTNLFLSTEALETAYRDLAPPFNIMVDSLDDENSGDFVNSDQSSTDLRTTVVPNADVTHFCFLIHGHRGLSRDLAYFQAVMQRWVSGELKKQKAEIDSTTESKSSEKFGNTKRTLPCTHDMVVHNAVCNEGKTQDGIENGGERLVEEFLQVIETEMKKRHSELENQEDDIDDEDSKIANAKIYDITISIVGNSLGGLFGRYAIAKLVERHCVKEEPASNLNHKPKPGPTWILDGKYRLQLNIFCTTATPHLGVSGHTWVRIPRTAEIGVAHALGQSGKDLFRLNDLLHRMATSQTFLGPLGSFRKRIAYANCYGTDFAVPVGTAAFLSENSTYPHHFLDDYIVDENGMVIAVLHTPAKEDTDEALEKHSDELHEMSSSLDKLGWKKVFVDIRREMPSVELPKSIGERLLRQKKQSSDPENGNLSGSNHSRDSLNSTGSDEFNENVQSLQALKKQRVVGSKDIAGAVRTPEDNRVALPLGHNMIVAFSRSRLATFMNKGGRPVVDALARELVDDIFSWDGSSNPPPVCKSMTSTTFSGSVVSVGSQPNQ